MQVLRNPDGSVDISGVASSITDGTATSHANGESLMDGICIISMKVWRIIYIKHIEYGS